MPNMSISGVASGIDWDSMIAKIIENAKKPAYVQLEKRDKLELKKSLFEEFLISLRAFQSTLSPLRLSSTFKAKQVVIDRLDSNASHKGVLNATVNADAEVNVYDLEVLQLARGQINRSKQMSSPTAALGSSGYFYIYAAGQKIRIDVKASDTLETLTAEVNSKLQGNIPPVKVTATIVDNRLILRSEETGTGTTKVSTTLKRGAGDTDLLAFPVNPNNAAAGTYTLNVDIGGINGGEFIIKKDGAEYKPGVDFDIVNGSEIRWRTVDYNYTPAGNSYQATYATAGTAGAVTGEVYTLNATRAASGNTDKNVINIRSDVNPSGFDPSRIRITSIGGGTEYQEGRDYSIQGKDVIWLEGGLKPSAGLGYKIEYNLMGGEDITINARRSDTDAIFDSTSNPVLFSDFTGKTVTIAVGSKTYVQGADFDVVRNSDNTASIRWKAYNAPAPSVHYDISLDGINTYTVTRQDEDVINLAALGFSGAGGADLAGTLSSVTYNERTFTPSEVVVVKSGNEWTLTWSDIGETPNFHGPALNDDYTVEYTYNKNTFRLDDDGNGVLAALGLLNDYSAAQDAVLILDGERVIRSSNYIGTEYGNELIKGMSIELRGLGRVALDVEHDASVAVDAINNFLSSYNDIMKWINVRMTEKEVDQSTKSTLSYEDVRWKWGLLNGNSLLRSSKNALRQLTSKVFIPSFTNRAGHKQVYGTMQQNGITSSSSFTVKMGVRSLTVEVKPTDTLQDIVSRINNPDYPEPAVSKDGNTYSGGNPLFYDPGGYLGRVARAEVENGRLVIKSERADWLVTVEGSHSVLSALGINYEYTALSQIGIKLPTTGGSVTEDAKAGVLEFDTNKFMEAMRSSPDDVAMLFSTFSSQMQTYMDDMVRSSQKEIAPGVVTTYGSVPREMNFIDDEIRSIDKYLADFERRLQNRQQALFSQYSAAEVSMSKLIQQASWLASVTAQLQSQQFSS